MGASARKVCQNTLLWKLRLKLLRQAHFFFAIFIGFLPSMVSADENRFSNIETVRELLISALQSDAAFDAVEADPSEPANVHVRAGDVSLTLNVTNLFTYLNAYPDESEDEAVGSWVSAAKDAIEGANQAVSPTVDETGLIVVLRTREYLESLVEAGSAQPLASQFSGPLYLTYMLDASDSIVTLTEDNRKQRSNDQLFDLAKANIRPWLKNAVEEKLEEGGSAFFVDGNTFLGPSLILLDEFWASVSASFPGDVIIAIPRKDQLFLFRADSPNAAARARAVTEATFEDDFNLLSDVLLVRRGDKIELLQE